MKNTLNKINGSETGPMNKEEQALSLFYKAFNAGDMQGMEQSWLTTNDSSMNNPIGGIRRGWTEIRNGYEKIFRGDTKVFVEFYEYTIHKTGDMFFAAGRERGYFNASGPETPLAIRTTRVFIKLNGEWKQLHHHGSIDDPVLLKNYQEAIVIK